MEIVLCGCLTSIWWMSSATVLLPFVILLKCSKCFRDWWLSLVKETMVKKPVRFLIASLVPEYMSLRKKAFELLKERLSERDTSKSLKVLEIGIGSGANLQFYPENSHLTSLDKNIHSHLKKNQKKFKKIIYERNILSVAENMEDVDDCSMDVVISTYVLCSVTSLNDVMKEVKRVLKPGGNFLFLEHVSYPESEWGFTIQKFTSPLCFVYFKGGCLSRNIGDVIRNFGFSDVVCEQIFPETFVIRQYIRPQIYGLAIK